MRGKHLLLVPPLLVVAVAFAQPPEASVGGFEGVWKMCYAPGLEGVYEIDAGYLVLMPDGEYYEVNESGGDLTGPKPPFWERNSYRVEGSMVVLRDETYVGTVVERRLTLREGEQSVLFDMPRADPQPRDVLAGVGHSINYGYCRVYPDWPVREAPHDNPFQRDGDPPPAAEREP